MMMTDDMSNKYWSVDVISDDAPDEKYAIRGTFRYRCDRAADALWMARKLVEAGVDFSDIHVYVHTKMVESGEYSQSLFAPTVEAVSRETG